MFKAIIIFFLMDYLIPIIWFNVPNFSNDNKLIKIIRFVLLGMYIFPIFVPIFLALINNSLDLLFNPLTHQIFIYPFFIYAYMIKLTLKK